MTDILLIGETVIRVGWEFFTKTYIPGLDISVAQLSIGVLLISICITLVGQALDISFGSSGQGYGSRGSKKVKVSKERRGDDR